MLKPFKKWILKRLIDVFDNHYLRLDAPSRFRAVDFVNCVAGDTMLNAIINRVPLLIPAGYLQMFPFCHQQDSGHPLVYSIETTHCDWMTERLTKGSVAVDIGTSAGIITAAMSRAVGDEGMVFAFEPARRASAMLQRVVTANQLKNVTCEQIAICNDNGSTLFMELGDDPTGEIPWLPEASAIMSRSKQSTQNASQYEVKSARLDDYFASFTRRIQMIKIDVEGFEIEVLRGARSLIRRDKPYFSIDIHQIPDGDGDTESGVKSILGEFGYRFDRLGHVLVASPADS